MDEGIAPEAAAAADHGDKSGALELDPRLVQLADRAAAAGLGRSWRAFKSPQTGEPEGPCWLAIDIRSGRRVRHMHVRAEEVEAVTQFKFEQWIALDGYEAILDTSERVIVAEVKIRPLRSLNKLPGVIKESLEGNPEVPNSAALPKALRETCYLTIPSPRGNLSLELYSFCPPEIDALKGGWGSGSLGNGLIINDVDVTRHDEALELLLDLSTSLFIDLDIGHGLTASLVKAYDA
jgi:hypothetical protein